MNYATLFMDSVRLHQQLVNILIETRDDRGFSLISQPEIAARIDRSQTWVASAIKRLNTEEACIEMVASGMYKLNYEDILSQGVFSKILLLIVDTQADPTMIAKKDSEIAEEYGFKLKTVQMYKAYLRTGWKVSSRSDS